MSAPEKWYALHTNSRAEKKVEERLKASLFEAFCPKIITPSRRRDRKVMLSLPLFPGYVFVKSDLSAIHHLSILKVSGAVTLVGGSQGPVPIPETNIASLKIMENQPGLLTGTRFKPGDRVCVVAGPLAGVRGYFTRYGGCGRVVVEIEALGRFAAVEVDTDDLKPWN